MLADIDTSITFSDNSIVAFSRNKATFGATTYSNGNSKIITKANSTIVFDDILARWCNNTCLAYTGQSDTVTVDNDGIVWCSNQEAFVCLSIKCYCKNLEELLGVVKSYTVINITDRVMTLSSVSSVKPLQDINKISIIGHNNATVICVNSFYCPSF